MSISNTLPTYYSAGSPINVRTLFVSKSRPEPTYVSCGMLTYVTVAMEDTAKNDPMNATGRTRDVNDSVSYWMAPVT